ncbi:enoyl-CoA hydratase/isomerase family protein [Gordonia alkaliphila]|uniref:Enoyl-CoA hydratase/isomerase family protein n=1 Tax=Gordonia alkaliphila TaxID=1053547 RepID=A0ABP8Z7A8_9ACTN|nr:enoyl-CoA hydratase/isomerase family protein [Gordonia alkaliphila]MCK0440028.1 enoyl-CoA hydratase/isomerase family protein [Gordonia alkaliphila]
MPYFSLHDDAAEVYLGAPGRELDETNPENRFTLGWLDEVNQALDEAVAAGKPIVLTATGKYFTNGLDTDFIASNFAELPGYLDRIHQLYVRVLTLPVPSIAALNGHAFGGGAMLALCADHRIMRTERGFWSLPEAALNMPFTRGMAALVRTRTPDATATEAMLTSRRYGADDAVAAGIVEEAVDADALLERGRELARERASLVNDNLATIKRGLRLPLLEDLNTPVPPTLL